MSGLSFLARPRHKPKTDARDDERQRRLDRQAADLSEREAALEERERNVRRRERAFEKTESSPRGEVQPGNSTRTNGPEGTPSGRMSKEARLIIDADQQRRAGADDVPLPTDKTARMIAEFARDLGKAQNARTDASGLSPAAKLILDADLARRGHDIDEAK